MIIYGLHCNKKIERNEPLFGLSTSVCTHKSVINICYMIISAAYKEQDEQCVFVLGWNQNKKNAEYEISPHCCAAKSTHE